MSIPARVATTVLFDLKVFGVEHVPRSGGAILASNHQSYLDPVLLAVRLPRPVSFLAKSELFSNRAFAWLIRSLHAFPVRQGAGDVAAMREAIRRVQEGYLLNIYPEGTRTWDGQLQPIQPGIALVVKRAGVPVIPAVIDGAYEAFGPHRSFPRPWPILLAYGPPMKLQH
ncbi:MAG: 1-acyl-sn-glycerol-3-phosphate acyltransferase, partial [Phycisphaerae bacterium]|nr:1-acyl-sn-glycerol-3-phosphate acyltransferase [Phycisphaerae bacterium]